MTLRERLLFHSAVDPESGCWNWTGGCTPTGYGVIRVEDSYRGAHRTSYLAFVGEVPDGHELDHLCRNRACINPHHLEPVTHRQNILRGDSPTAKNARKTHCAQGHPYDAANTYHKPGGGRECRTCRKQWKTESNLRKKAASL